MIEYVILIDQLIVIAGRAEDLQAAWTSAERVHPRVSEAETEGLWVYCSGSQGEYLLLCSFNVIIVGKL